MALAVQTFVACRVAVSPCPVSDQVTVTGVLVPPDFAPLLSAVLEGGGLDWDVVDLSFEAGVWVWSIGVGFGLILKILRRL